MFKEETHFISPFSISRGYELNLKSLDSRWQGTNDFSALTSVDDVILKAIHRLGMVTALQLHKTFYDRNIKTTIKNFKRLTANGLVVKHEMKDKSKEMDFYTLGPAGARFIKKPYQPNWWEGLKTDVILRQLVFNQLFLRMYKAKKCKLIKAEYPLAGTILINETDFPVAVIRGDSEDIIKEIKLSDLERLVVICEDRTQIPFIAERVEVETRFTTDYELCNCQLDQAFYVYENGALEKETIQIFSS